MTKEEALTNRIRLLVAAQLELWDAIVAIERLLGEEVDDWEEPLKDFAAGMRHETILDITTKDALTLIDQFWRKSRA